MNVELSTSHEPLPAGRILAGGHFTKTDDGCLHLSRKYGGIFRKQSDMKVETRCGCSATRQTVECSRQAADMEQNLAAARAVLRMNERLGKWREQNLKFIAQLVDPWENTNS